MVDGWKDLVLRALPAVAEDDAACSAASREALDAARGVASRAEQRALQCELEVEAAEEKPAKKKAILREAEGALACARQVLELASR
eukprot:5350770-Lingulodinium_polyedra.AAC.1